MQTTPTPNHLYDTFLKTLKPAELKVLLVIIRQTLGWMNKQTGKRKQWDWISNKQFRTKTGLSNKSVTGAIATLLDQRLIDVRNAQGIPLSSPKHRQHSDALYYGLGRNLIDGITTIP